MIIKFIVVFEIIVLALAMSKLKTNTINKKREIIHADTEGKEND